MMKPSAKSLTIALLVVLVAAAATATTASAYEFDVEGLQVTEPTNVEGTSGVSLLATTVAGVKAEIECTQDTLTGKVETGGNGSTTLLLKKCTESKPAHCSVPETIEGKLKDKLIGTGTPEELFEAASGGTISEIKITGAECAISGVYPLKGTQTCELPKAEEEVAEHETACKTSGSKLKIGEVTATFSSVEKVKLTSGKKWAVLGVKAARTEKVDFEGNQALLIDHRSNTAHGGSESALAITEYGAKNEIEWELSKAAELAKTWPVVYVLGGGVKLETSFGVEAATREFLEKKVEGEPELVGETTVASGSLKFKKKLTIEQIKTQFTAHPEYLTTGEIESTSSLVKKVARSLATITWKWTLKEKGRANPITQELGKSTHYFYLLYKTPVAGTKIFFTVLDLDTLAIGKEAEPLNEAKVILGVWGGFSNKQKEAACLTLECPTLRIRTYNPANGAISQTGNVLWYYEAIPVSLTLQRYRQQPGAICGGRSTTILLLATLSGECGAWARMFKNALGTEGLASTRLAIYAKFPNGDLVCEAAEECFMLVKTWTFAGGAGTSGEPTFPYTWAEVTDENGVAGQGIENPRSFFKNHQIVEVGNKLYDPSYGTEPVGNGSPGERTNNLASFQEQNLTGFCRWTGTKWNCKPTEAAKPKLAATELPGVESEEEAEEELVEP